MPSSSRRSGSLAAVRRHRRGQRARQPELGLERLDSRLALSASAQLFGRWLRLQPPAAIASAAAAAPRLAPPTIAAARIAATAAAPTVTAVTTSNGGPYGSDTGGYTVTVTGSGFVNSSGISQVQAVGFWPTPSSQAGGTGAVTVVPGSGPNGGKPSPQRASIQFQMPNLQSQLPTLPANTAVVVTANSQNSSTTQGAGNTFTFAQQALVTSISYAGRSNQAAANPSDPGLQAQNGPLTGGGTLVINGSGFVAGSTVQFVDYGTPQKTVTVPASGVNFVSASQLSLTVPKVSTTWSSDTTVAVNVVPPGSQPIPSAGAANGAGGFQNQFTFYKSSSMTFDIKLRPEVVAAGQAAGGIYLVAYSQVGDRTGTNIAGNKNMQPVIMQVSPGVTARQNVGTWELGTNMLTSSDTIDASKYGTGLSFGTTPDKDGYVTATVAYENLIYSQGYSNVSAGAVLSIGGFPLMSAPLGKAGSPTVGTNPGLLYGLTELNISGLATTNYSAPSSVVDVSFVDQFGIPLTASMAPAAPFPVNRIGLTISTTRQGAVTGFANAVKQSTVPGASGFAPLLSASPGGVLNPSGSGQASAGTTQILAPFTYLSAVEKFSGIKPATVPLSVTGGSLQAPGDSTGYFYWVTAVGDGEGETMAFGTGQQATAPNTDPIFNTTYQALPGSNNAILVSWAASSLPQGLLGPGSIPLNLQATATAYNVYRAPAYVTTGPEPISPLTLQKLTSPLPGTALSFLDDGTGIWQTVPSLPASNATYSSLSGFFDAALDTFFANYTASNSFEIFRDGITWQGNTVDPTNTGSGTPFTYVTADQTVHHATAYGRALLLTDAANPSNQFVWLDPSAGPTTLANNVYKPGLNPPTTATGWMQNGSNLGFSAGYQIFGACGAAGDGGPANVTVDKVNPWADLQNSLAAAFDRGLATTFTVKPDAWANPPQFNAAAKVSARTGTWAKAQLAPHTWAVTGVTAAGVETVYGVVTQATPQRGKAVTLQWSTQPTGSQPYTSFNLYRARGMPGQALTFRKVNAQPIPMPASGQTVVFHDRGGTPPVATSQPVTYWAPGTVHDVYAAYQHRIAVNGLAYGYAYDDQGGMSSTYTANGNPVSLNGYLSKVTVGGLRWGTVGNPRATDGTANTRATGIAIAPVPQQIPMTPTSGSIMFSLAQTTLSVQVMAQDTKTQAAFPAFGTTGWTVKVVANPGTALGKALPGMMGKSFPVSYLSGQAQVPLLGSAPVKGNTYTVNLQLMNGSTAVGGPQSVTITAY